MSTDFAAAVGYALFVPYLVVALKRVYAESMGLILLKAGKLALLVVSLNGPRSGRSQRRLGTP